MPNKFTRKVDIFKGRFTVTSKCIREVGK